MDRVKEIIRAMEEAFSGVPRGVVTLHEAEVIDDYGTDAERLRARTYDVEEDWREVPDWSIEECPDALSFVDPVSWRFYLPAYMRFGLRHLEDSRNAAIDHAIYSLDRGDDPHLAAFKLERFQTLNDSQADVVRQFLELASENGAHCDGVIAKNALAAYWNGASGTQAL